MGLVFIFNDKAEYKLVEEKKAQAFFPMAQVFIIRIGYNGNDWIEEYDLHNFIINVGVPG